MPASPFQFAISATFTAEPLERVIAFWDELLGVRFETVFAPYNQPLQTLLDPASVFARNQHGVNVVLARHGDVDPPEIERARRDFAVPLIIAWCPGELTALYPVEQIFDAHGERLGDIPFTESYYAALGTALVRRAHALTSPPWKVIVLDCDNTLWRGICGEDGPHGVIIDSPRRALQEFMLAQREQGMLLAIASKNNERDVLDTFAAHPEMPLRLEHFAVRRCNWETKASNLASIAAELNVGLESFIFVDDNPLETAELAEILPQVLALTLPEEAKRTPEFLRHVWAFDHAAVTEEDRKRSQYYRQKREFAAEAAQSMDLSEFIRGLELQVEIRPLVPERLARAAQLTQRTNQFNFTTIRRSEAVLRSLDATCVTVDARDRFGDYGTVGLMIYRAAKGALELDTFLLSCRALGRGVEHRMLAWLGGEAVRGGLAEVVATFQATVKNAPARQFLDSLAGSTGGGYRFEARTLVGMEWTPAAPVAAPVAAALRPAERRPADYQWIATDFATAAAVVEAMRGDAGGAGLDAERVLLGIWRDLLRRDDIRRNDNFFDLGGHSLLAVLLILRVREALGVELAIDDVYAPQLTLGELAARVEAARSGAASTREYEALLAEIEALSDDEVRALLEKEGDADPAHR